MNWDITLDQNMMMQKDMRVRPVSIIFYITHIYFISHIIRAIIYYYYNTPAKINVLIS